MRKSLFAMAPCACPLEVTGDDYTQPQPTRRPNIASNGISRRRRRVDIVFRDAGVRRPRFC